MEVKVTFFKNGKLKEVHLKVQTDSLSAIASILGVANSAIKSISRV